MVDDLSSGGGGVALVEGMAGIGKSVLVEQVARLGRGASCTVTTGRADELDQITPMGALLSGLRAAQTPVLTTNDLVVVQAGDQRIGVLDRLCQILEIEAVRHPLMIIVDDLQWADRVTLLAVASLPLRLVSVPIMWVLARRTGAASAQLDLVWRRLDEGGASIMHLGPIDKSAVADITRDLVGAAPGPSLARELARAAGNPFYLTELLRRLSEAKALELHGGYAHLRRTATQLSLSVVASHLSSLSELGRRLVEIGSVLGDKFRLTMVADMLGLPAGSLVEAVSECVSAQLLADEGDMLAFRHDLLRQAAYAELPEPVRVALHRDAARLLTACAASPLEVAPHLARGARGGDTAAVDGLFTAAAQLLGTNPSAAADLGLRALGLLGHDDGRRAEIGAFTVEALGWADRLAEAQSLGDQIVADVELDPTQQAIIELGIRRSWYQSSNRPYPRPVPQRLIDHPDLPPSFRLCLLALDAQISMGEDLTDSARRLKALRAEADACGADDFAMNGIMNAQTMAEAFSGRMTVALDGYQAWVEWSEQRTLLQHIGGFHFFGAYILYALDRIDEALKKFQVADDEAHRLGTTYVLSMTDAVRGAVLYSVGRLDDAAAAADSARQLAEDFELGRNLAECLRVSGEVALAQGNVAVASACADAVDPLLEEGSAAPTAAWLPALLADAQGDPQRALSVLAPALDGLSHGYYWLVLPESERLPALVSICLRARRPDLATMVTTQAAALASHNPTVPLMSGVALQCRGLLDGDEQALAEAVSSLRRSYRPLALATALEDLGHLRRTIGDVSGGTGALDEAYDVSSRCGAERACARLRRTLRGLGVVKRTRAAARPTSGWESLTKAEMTVVRLVATGLSSQTVADQLYLSLNTVNTHMRHIFSKLELRSRVELTRAFVEREQQNISGSLT
jgi:DNA-binding CsgD family transcriptional regulator/tetratricopeptide (TPR) repeat protein